MASPPPATRRRTDWAALPEGPLSVIAAFLPSIFDYAALRAVCSSWRGLPPKPLPASPLLLLPYKRRPYRSRDAATDSKNTAHLFSLLDRRRLRLRLPGFAHLRLLPLAHGHFLAVGLSPSLSLINPFTSSSVPLPPLTAFPDDDALSFSPSRAGREYSFLTTRHYRSARSIRDGYISAAVISADPTGSGCVVMVLLSNSGNLAFCRPGDQSWISVDAGFTYGIHCAASFHGKFYIMKHNGGHVMVCDASYWPPKPTIMSSSPWFFDQGMILVDAGEELLLIAMELWPRHGRSILVVDAGEEYFEVFRMQLTPAELTWVPIREIGGKALFLDKNYTDAVTASEFPGCRPNCIYFHHHDHDHEDHIILVFSIEDGSCEEICRYHKDSWDRQWRYPDWFFPRLA